MKTVLRTPNWKACSSSEGTSDLELLTDFRLTGDVVFYRRVHAGWTRPLDDLTHQVILKRLSYRSNRWPDTANPHLIINKQTAMETGPVSKVWLPTLFRRQPATIERLRVHRQLEEPSPGDPTRFTWPGCSASTARPRSATRTTPGNCSSRPSRSKILPVTPTCPRTVDV